MKFTLLLFFLSGVLFFISLLSGVLFVFKKNTPLKLRSVYSVFLAACLLIYLICTLFVTLYGLIKNSVYFSLFIIFAVMPFIIGRISSFRTLAFYTFLQLLTTLSGAVSSYYLLINC